MIVICVVAAILGIQIFIKRSLQGRYKESADQIGGQYAPGQARVNMITRIEPILIHNEPKTIWLKYPEGHENAGKYIIDEFGLPVQGIETNTSYTEVIEKSGKEELDKFESSLFPD